MRGYEKQTLTKVKVADEIWIALALLHRENPEAPDFLIEEIVDRARREGLHEPLRAGVYVRAVLLRPAYLIFLVGAGGGVNSSARRNTRRGRSDLAGR